ncbi:RusA family crossover junction endodeoxyribonuclease [Streptomyces zaomyceticus]|uniref:RusA family crossover junction endodeoxyribonuclease n=1 Tax=Streptomyces zaomyceticus TaxID=68286 RepID=UPI0037A34EDD
MIENVPLFDLTGTPVQAAPVTVAVVEPPAPVEPPRPEAPLNQTGDSLLPVGGQEADQERALRLVQALAPGTGEIKMLTIPGDPPSKSRPRFAKGGRTYKTKADTDAEERTAWYFRRVFREAWTGNVAVGCVFFRPNRQRIDVDNMLKHICDAANGIAWVDDSQVTAIYGVAELDIDKPRTLVVVAHHRSTLERGTDDVKVCAHCGETYPRSGTKQPRYCSRKCSNAARGQDLSVPVKCKACTAEFRRSTTEQVFCSVPCAKGWQKGRPRNRTNNRSKCADCGKQLAHSRGGRCRACWIASPDKSGSGPEVSG